MEARQLGGGDRVDVERRVEQLVEDRCGALPGDRGRALADDPDPGDRAVGEFRRDRRRQRPIADDRRQRSVGVASAILPRSVLAKLVGDSEISFSRIVRCVAAVDVACRHLGGDDVVGSTGTARAVVGEAEDAVELTGGRRIDRDDLAAVLAVHPDVAAASPRPRRTARSRRCSSRRPRPTYRPWPLPRRASSSVEGDAAVIAPIGDGTLERRHRAPERLDGLDTVGEVPGGDRRDHLGVGGDRPGDAQFVFGTEVAVVVDVAVEGSDDVRRSACCSAPERSASSELSGWVFGSLMMPTLAHRVWPISAARACGDDTARRSSASADKRRSERRGVVAEFADLGGLFVDEGEHRPAVGIAWSQRPIRSRRAGRCRARR